MTLASLPMPPWQAHTTVWLLIIVLEGGYFALLRRAGGGERTATKSQKILWTAGVATMWVAADWPIHDLAERYLYSVHMVQHMLLSLVAPPLLLLGTPEWLARWILSPKWLLSTVRQLSRPFVALALFNGYLVFSHWPTIVEASVSSEIAHFCLHAVLVVTSLLMFMPVLSPLREIKRLSPGAQMLYLFLQSIVPTVPASFLTLSDGVIYRVYATYPRIWEISAIEDQRVAGVIMKLVGGLLLWGLIAAVFFRWAAREQRADQAAVIEGVHRIPSDGVLTWEQVEAEFQRLGPPPASSPPASPPATPSET